MSIEALKAQIPDYARDLRLNLSGIPNTEGLTPQQLWGTALAAALASREGEVIAAIASEARAHLDDAALQASKAAAAIMGMNNIYYRFVHLCGDGGYATMPARLRMQVIGNPGVDKLDFELWALAVSAINGCGMCLESHEKQVLGKGATRATVQNVVRIASIVHAVAVAIEGERHLQAAGADAATA